MLDIDNADSTSKSAAKAIDESLQKFDLPDAILLLSGAGSYAGGRGELERVERLVLLKLEEQFQMSRKSTW